MNGLGQWALWLALAASAIGCWMAIAGGALRNRVVVRAGASSLHTATVLVLLSLAALARALWTSDFSILYVASFSSLIVPRAYQLGALWGGPAGSLLIWTLCMACVASVALFAHRRSFADRLSWFTAVLGAAVAVLAAATVFAGDPFARLSAEISEGRGLDPVLQSPWMLLHPPFLLLGTAATLPLFASTVAAMAVRRCDDAWRAAVRSWSLVAFTLIVAGVVIGMRWAYAEPGWGGYWSWDPVEVAGAVPLVVLGVLVHVLRRRGTSPAEIAALSLAPFPLTLAGAWVARSDALRTVHGFVQSSSGWVYAAMAIAAAGGAAALVVVRREWLAIVGTPGEAPRADAGMPVAESALSGIARRLSHAGMILFVVAAAVMPFRRAVDAEIATGSRYATRDLFGREWTFTSQGVSRYAHNNFYVSALPMSVSSGGRRLGIVTTEERQPLDAEENELAAAIVRVGSRASLLQDVQVELLGANEAGARVRIRFWPLASFLWLGGALVAFAGLLALVAGPRPPD